ncbi:unnamed protein product [Phyllotreta striolata]|uniref:CHK kinase-like domain-containing protein n=1 Tax=Phyllotreta striolata TaxID=444603 RepID=A0A9N9THU9_PHYSR|nr:unnamed protein product [Phyllotreta striolata]
MNDENRNTELVNWFKKALGTEECTVELQGMKEKGDGYLADINFAKITLNETNKNSQELYLIAKVSRTAVDMRSFSEDLCKREVAFYAEIVPLMYQFQKEKSIERPFKALPKCYKAFETKETEVIVQDNMVQKGYRLHNKRIPMNMNHIKLALRNYAKFHAISLALNDQRPEEFERIERNYTNLFLEKINLFEGMYKSTVEKVIGNLIEIGRSDLAKRYEKLMERGTCNILIDLFNDLPKERVITHADCHNGNLLFKYRDNEENNPTDMVMLDFQISCVFSPMIDLALFLYCGGSKVELDQLEYILEYYHKELSSFLSELGSDVEKLFPVSVMWEHWRKYAFHGFNGGTCILELFFVETDDVPNFDDTSTWQDDGSGSGDQKLFNIKVKNREPYLERLRDIVEHYLNFNKIH